MWIFISTKNHKVSCFNQNYSAPGWPQSIEVLCVVGPERGYVMAHWPMDQLLRSNTFERITKEKNMVRHDDGVNFPTSKSSRFCQTLRLDISWKGWCTVCSHFVFQLWWLHPLRDLGTMPTRKSKVSPLSLSARAALLAPWRADYPASCLQAEVL